MIATMHPGLHLFISLDLPAMLAGTLSAVACALLGNFLVLRRQSLLGDAISHAVLPGLVAAFLLTSMRTTWPMFFGALAAGLIAAGLIEVVRRLGRMEQGASMGVVFSVMFALGVLLMEQAAARHVDLDAQCVLYGQLEYVNWYPPAEWPQFWTRETFLGSIDAETGSRTAGFPRQVTTLAATAVVALLFVVVFFKELRISSFDPSLSTALGIHAGAMHAALVALVAAAAVASFEAVGSILVIAMLICPAATARLLTDRLATQVWISAGVAVVTGAGGYVLGALLPGWLGFDHALNAAGTMSALAGALLAMAALFGPRHGVAAKRLRRTLLGAEVAREDLLGLLWRLEESGAGASIERGAALRTIGGGLAGRLALRRAQRAGEIERTDGAVALTESGRARARTIVRSHRLWETYLVEEMGLRADHVHDTAALLEHTRAPEEAAAQRDPHGRWIPGAEEVGPDS